MPHECALQALAVHVGECRSEEEAVGNGSACVIGIYDVETCVGEKFFRAFAAAFVFLTFMHEVDLTGGSCVEHGGHGALCGMAYAG